MNQSCALACCHPSDRTAPVAFKRRQGQGLGFEVIEKEALFQAEVARNLRPVNPPCGIGELEVAAFDRTGSADHGRGRPRAAARQDRFHGLSQSGKVCRFDWLQGERC